jgi:hypothetical protein
MASGAGISTVGASPRLPETLTDSTSLPDGVSLQGDAVAAALDEADGVLVGLAPPEHALNRRADAAAAANSAGTRFCTTITFVEGECD